jgi:hypothetical protein
LKASDTTNSEFFKLFYLFIYLFIYLFVFYYYYFFLFCDFVLFKYGCTPAFGASQEGHTQTLALLLENKADANANDPVF